MIQAFQARGPLLGESIRSLLSRIALAISPSIRIVLANAARTATTSTTVLVSGGHRGMLLTLDVSAASGTGGLQVQLMSTVTGVVAQAVNTAPTAVTATGKFTYMIYPGAAAGGYTQVTNAAVPGNYIVRVTHGDASSYTYEVAVQGIP